VGPKPDGTFPQESIDRLKEMGIWMKTNGEAIYASKASPLLPFDWGRCTQKVSKNGTILYLSVFDWPKNGKLVVRGLKNEVVSAKLLADGTSLKTEQTGDLVTILVSNSPLDKIATVIKLEVIGTIENQNLGLQKKMKTGALD
jgi:alpha-L-fucosidase